jgi:hypothetical protein
LVPNSMQSTLPKLSLVREDELKGKPYPVLFTKGCARFAKGAQLFDRRPSPSLNFRL